MRIHFDHPTRRSAVEQLFLRFAEVVFKGEEIVVDEDAEASDLVVFCGLGSDIMFLSKEALLSIKDRMQAYMLKGKNVLLMSGNKETEVREAMPEASVHLNFFFIEKPVNFRIMEAFRDWYYKR